MIAFFSGPKQQYDDDTNMKKNRYTLYNKNIIFIFK